jgi:signal transduction histidine kinase
MADTGGAAAAPHDGPVGAMDAPADAADRGAIEREARLVRGVRWRLVAWSGGSTLLVLLALGLALYLSVATSLESTGLAALDQRAEEIRSFGRGPSGPGGADSPIDFLFGGGGTFAIVIAPNGTAIGPRQIAIPRGLPNTEAAIAAARTGRDVRTSTIRVRQLTVPVRQLTVPLDTIEGRYFVQVVQDRTAEERTLQSLVVVLVLGGLVVVLVAVAFGALYASRALVPIRESLAGQRASLQRQREFAADASHELRTPLTVIRSSVEHLRRNADRPVATVGDALVDIDAEVEHLTTLVDDLLLLARSDSGAITLERVPLHLDDVAADAAASLAKPAADAGVRIEVDPEPTTALGDAARLRQLVSILVDNAIRHSPRGGTVRVVVRPAGAGHAAAMLAVEDAGPGVAPEDRARVFDRFWRAPGAPAGGTGLGLAIARWIAEHHDGTISIDRSSGGGARFEVTLPSVGRTDTRHGAQDDARDAAQAPAPEAHS